MPKLFNRTDNNLNIINMNSFDPSSLILLLFPFAIIVFYYRRIKHKNSMIKEWASTETLQEYVAQYPDCKTKRGIKCCECGSSSIRNWGLFNSSDQRRLFVCNHCNTRLYRRGP